MGANLAFFVRLLFLPRADRIVALTSPPMIASGAAIVAKLKKSKLIYWVLDMNPDQAIAAGWLKEQSLLGRFLQWSLVHTILACNKVIVLDRYMQKRLLSKSTKIKEDNLHVIPMWSPQDVDETVDSSNSWRVRHGIDEKFVVMYSGNHSICHPLITLLNAARQMHDRDVVFLFVGNGVRAKEVSGFKETHGLSNIIQLPYQDRCELSSSLSAADLHVVVMGSPYVGIVHPSKVYGILAARRPFICIGPEDSPISDIAREIDPDLIVPHGDADRLVQLINDLKNSSRTKLDELSRKSATISSRYTKNSRASEVAEVVVNFN